MTEIAFGIVDETTDYIDFDIGVAQWQRIDSEKYFLEEDFKAGGDIWRVHKNDADPFPSRPHAHCVGGTKRFLGCKLHLGTGQLFRDGQPAGRRLSTSQFQRLIISIRPKFPGITLPLPG